jgi:hypothetical protein
MRKERHGEAYSRFPQIVMTATSGFAGLKAVISLTIHKLATRLIGIK